MQQLNPLDSVPHNKMLKKCLRVLMHRLLHQYRSQSYDVNFILGQYHSQLSKKNEEHVRGLSEIQINIEEAKKGEQRQSTRSQSAFWDQEQYEHVMKLWQQISIFIWEVSRCPKWYVEMLKKQQIYAEESECIDLHVFTTQIYKKVQVQALKMTPYAKEFQQICSEQVYFFIEQVSIQICQYFKSGQRIVQNQLKYATSIVQGSQIINFYLLYKIFKDIAFICKTRITTELQQGIFRNIQTEVVQTYALYIIQKYEILDMNMQNHDFEDRQIEQKVPITERIMNSNHVKWREAIREDGEIGILVELQDPKNEGQSVNYMLMFDQEQNITVVNSSSLSQQWKVCKKAQKNYDIVNLVKNKKALAQKMRNTSTSPVQMTLISNVGVIGGSMGKCLAQIDTYDNVGDFMVSLSKRTAIGGSFNYMLTQVPLLGYFFITGGFTYTFYYIFTNKYANSKKKMRELKSVTFGSLASVGSGLIGAAMGQTLIPVPILGAFIGGLVVGFIGEFGARKLSSYLQSARFQKTVRQMRRVIQPKGYWQANKQTLNILEINKQKFYETIPTSLESRINCDRIWLTVIFFTMLSFHESKKRAKEMEISLQQAKRAQKLQRKMSEYEMINQNQRMTTKNQYEPSPEFMLVIKYFSQNNIMFLEFHDEVTFILEKIFARLK